jgi:hypothetical protein
MLDANSWTLDDIQLFNSWFFDDPVAYSRPNLERLEAAVHGSGSRTSVGEAWHAVTDNRGWLLVVVALAGACGAAGAPWRAGGLVALQIAWAMSVFVATASTQRFPDRVALPMFFGLALVCALAPTFVAEEPPEERTADARRRVAGRARLGAHLLAAALLLTVVLWPLRTSLGPKAVSRWNGQRELAFSWQLAALDRLDPDGRFVAVGDALALDAVSPFEDEGPFASARVLQLGWPIGSPLYEQRKHEMGLDGDLMQHLRTEPDVYAVMWPGVADLVASVYTRRTGEEVRPTTIAQLPNGADVVQFS